MAEELIRRRMGWWMIAGTGDHRRHADLPRGGREVGVLDDWLRHTGGSIGMDRRIFLAVSGAALTTPAWSYVDHLGTRGGSFNGLADGRRSITVTSAMVDAVAVTTAGLRNLGDGEGG
ncbi:MAG TPA: hypothetical protein VFQ48_02455, partial [Pseudonocardiaceae bacterium]|nr:hypothetical protein [Pseudonocardiaceae bacterium]